MQLRREPGYPHVRAAAVHRCVPPEQQGTADRYHGWDEPDDWDRRADEPAHPEQLGRGGTRAGTGIRARVPAVQLGPAELQLQTGDHRGSGPRPVQRSEPEWKPRGIHRATHGGDAVPEHGRVEPADHREHVAEHIPGSLHPQRRGSDLGVTHWGAKPAKGGVAAVNPRLFTFVGGKAGGWSRSYHTGIVNAVFMDGSVKTIPNSIDPIVWRALGTRASLLHTSLSYPRSVGPKASQQRAMSCMRCNPLDGFGSGFVGTRAVNVAAQLGHHANHLLQLRWLLGRTPLLSDSVHRLPFRRREHRFAIQIGAVAAQTRDIQSPPGHQQSHGQEPHRTI